MKRFLVMAGVALVVAGAFAQGMGPRRNNLLGRRNPLASRGSGSGAKTQAAAQDAEEQTKAVMQTNGVPSLAFKDAPLELVLKEYAERLGKIVLPAPDLPKVQITLNSDSLGGQLLTKDEYLEAIEVVLTMNGVVLEPRGDKFIRALARKTVRTQGIPVLMREGSNLPEKGRVVSQMITFRNIGVDEGQKALEGFKDPAGLFQVFERTNSILVTDTQENINRMLEIVKAIDIATPVLEEVFVYQVQHAVATDIKTALETIVTESQKEDKTPTSGAKTSGAPGFGSAQRPTSLLGGLRKPQQPEPPKANETMTAGISDADRGMIRGKVLILADERSNKLIIITNKANYNFFEKVIKTLDVPTDPEFKVEVIRLRYADAEEVSDMLNDLIGGMSSGSSSKKNQNQNAAKGKSGNMTTGKAATPGQKPATGGAVTGQAGNRAPSSVGDLNKDNCKVLSDKRINGVVIMTRTELMPIIKAVVEDMDVRLSQVLIETAIVEVQLGDDLQTGMDWVRLGAKQTTDIKGGEKSGIWRQKLTGYNAAESTGTDDDGNPIYSSKAIKGKDGKWYEPVYEWTQDATDLVVGHNVSHRTGFWSGDKTGNMIGGGGGLGGDLLKQAAGLAVSNATDSTLNPIGAGLNYFFKSDKLNLGAVIQASKTDSRSKYLASPIVMTVDNKEATIEATEMSYLLKGYTYSGSTYNGTTVPDYEQKELGITIKTTPKINPDGTVMLTVETEYSQVGAEQTIEASIGGDTQKVSVPTTITRKMSADISLENLQTVVLGGLTQTSISEAETGIPFLKDIPYIGKYLFGTTKYSEGRKELLIFMTPYVLDDGDVLQAEALRRKKALSDSRPWEDFGWSKSALADPISKREALRRLTEEWKKQDEERKTKLAIEKAKVERVKALESMTKEERKFWLEMHKEELKDEEQEALEKKMLDEKSQEELRKLAAEVRAKKLQEAKKVIDENTVRVHEEAKETKAELQSELEAEKNRPPKQASVVVEKKSEPPKQASVAVEKKPEPPKQSPVAVEKKSEPPKQAAVVVEKKSEPPKISDLTKESEPAKK